MLRHPKLEIAAISNDVWIVYSLYGPSIYCYGMLRLNQSLSEGKGCFCLDNNQQMHNNQQLHSPLQKATTYISGLGAGVMMT